MTTSTAAEREASVRGWNAYKTGSELSDNPYEAGTALHVIWADNWEGSRADTEDGPEECENCGYEIDECMCMDDDDGAD